jgi:hypothetical protein
LISITGRFADKEDKVSTWSCAREAKVQASAENTITSLPNGINIKDPGLHDWETKIQSGKDMWRQVGAWRPLASDPQLMAHPSHISP